MISGAAGVLITAPHGRKFPRVTASAPASLQQSRAVNGSRHYPG